MIYALCFLILVLLGGVVWLADSLLKLKKAHERAVRRLDAAWTEKMQRIETSLSEKAEAKRLRHLAAMVDGVAAVGQRLEIRLSEVEGAVRQSAPSSE